MEREQLIEAVKGLSVLSKQPLLREAIENVNAATEEEKQVKRNVVSCLLSISGDSKVWPAIILSSLVRENPSYKQPLMIDELLKEADDGTPAIKLFPFTLFGKKGYVFLDILLEKSAPKKSFVGDLFFEDNEQGEKRFGVAWEKSAVFKYDVRSSSIDKHELIDHIIADEGSYNSLLEKFFMLFEEATSIAAPLISERLKIHARVSDETNRRLVEARSLNNDLYRILAKKQK